MVFETLCYANWSEIGYTSFVVLSRKRVRKFIYFRLRVVPHFSQGSSGARAWKSPRGVFPLKLGIGKNKLSCNLFVMKHKLTQDKTMLCCWKNVGRTTSLIIIIFDIIYYAHKLTNSYKVQMQWSRLHLFSPQGCMRGLAESLPKSRLL